MNKDKELLSVKCVCGNWEEQSADMPRHKINSFELIRLFNDGNVLYRCECGALVKSKIIKDKIHG